MPVGPIHASDEHLPNKNVSHMNVVLTPPNRCRFYPYKQCSLMFLDNCQQTIVRKQFINKALLL